MKQKLLKVTNMKNHATLTPRWMQRSILAVALAVFPMYVQSAEVQLVGAEDFDYQLRLGVIAEGETFQLSSEKPTLRVTGCSLIEQTDSLIRLTVIHPNTDGTEITLYAPEAGRHSKRFHAGDYSGDINARLIVKDAATLTLEKTAGGVWRMLLGDSESTPRFYLVKDQQGATKRVRYTASGAGAFFLDLEQYTLYRESGSFIFRHRFRGRFVKLFGNEGIDFRPKIITLRTYETRLAQDYAPKLSSVVTIKVDRTPPESLIGATLRFGGSNGFGANLATVRSVDGAAREITVVVPDPGVANSHPAGRWLRAFYRADHARVIANQYPIAYLPPHDWTEGGDIAGSIAKEIATADPTGIFASIDIGAGGDVGAEFGFRLRDVTYGSGGINFIGGMHGIMSFGATLNFMGQKAEVGPTELDISSVFNTLADEIIAVNTYLKDAWVFFFNPDALVDTLTFGTVRVEFPFIFRLYFDRQFELNGGGLSLRPPKPIPISPFIGVRRLGGGFSRPSTFEVDARFTDLYMRKLPGISRDFWRLDSRVVLSMDEGYLRITAGGKHGKMDGLRMLEKVDLGSASATLQFDRRKRPAGEKWEGLVYYGRYGVKYSILEISVRNTFKLRKWPNSTYIGGTGSIAGSVCDVTVAAISASLNRERLRFKVDLWLYEETVVIKWRSIRSLLGLASSGEGGATIAAESMGIRREVSEDGFELVLSPASRRLGSRTITGSGGTFELANVTLQSGETTEAFTLTTAYPEVKLSIEYENDTTPAVSVTYPDGTTVKPVEILKEKREAGDEEPGMLYGVDFSTAVEDAPESLLKRQMLVTLPDPGAGEYLLTIELPPEQVDVFEHFEVVPVPAIVNLTATPVEGTPGRVELAWETEPVVPHAHYQLVMQKMADDETTAENDLGVYGLFEDEDHDAEGGEDGEPVITQETRLLPPGEIATTDNQHLLQLQLPANLASGNYRFVLTPVVLEHDGEFFEDPLFGDDAFSTPLLAHAAASSDPPPAAVWAHAIGNGVIRVGWTHAADPDLWNVTLLQDDAPIGAVTLSADELKMGVNQFSVTNIVENPFPQPPTVEVVTNNYLDIGGPDNPAATRNVIELEYNVLYHFDVTAVRRETGAWSDPETPIYNEAGGYHDLNVVEARLHGGALDFPSPLSRVSATATEPKTIRFAVFLEDDTTPAASLSLFEDGVPALQYDYETDTATLRNRVLDWDLLSVDSFDKIRIEADIPYERIGFSLRDEEGAWLIRIPPVNLPEVLAVGDVGARDAWIESNVPAAHRDQLKALLDENALAATSQQLDILMNAVCAAVLVGQPLPRERYLADIEGYTTEGDVTHASLVINLNALPLAGSLYALTYSPGGGGGIEGDLLQTVVHGGTGTVVTAIVTDTGAHFGRWSDGVETAGRQDGPLHNHRHAQAVFVTADGVPIDWYIRHGITPENGQTWSDLDALAPHGDNYTHRMAYLAGTDPNQPGTRLRVLSIEVGQPLRIVFDPETLRRRYALEFRTNLIDGAWQAVYETTGDEWEGGSLEHTPSSGAPGGFYRIRALQQ